MARCYHDEQDFQSDLHIEVAREGDMLEYGEDLPAFNKCTKNPGHSGFIPYNDLKLEHLPPEERSTKTFKNIKKWGKTVVRLVVDKKDGSPVNAGSGYVFNDGNNYCIKTNNHIVKTDDEVKHCKVEFFYDSHDRSNVLISKGVELLSTCPFRDISFFLFCPVPDFLTEMDGEHPFRSPPSIVIVYKNNHTVTCRSDSRYKSKQLTYYTCTPENLNDTQIDMMFMSLDDNYIGYLKSSYFKFRPVPSNIQELTSIEIHIDEDDGNSRVIPGDVIKINDDYVVRISESIFQDKVKKCKLVWNGEVISRGTRLYFLQVTSSEFVIDMSEIEIENFVKYTSPNIWLLDFYPLPRGVVLFNQYIKKFKRKCVMCCIGHPHGGIKMVTFGRYIGTTRERFDNKYRRISQPGKDCECKEVSCINYLCKTCPGSSGSPVFIPHEVFYITGSRNHFLGERVNEVLPNGELIENINMAWG